MRADVQDSFKVNGDNDSIEYLMDNLEQTQGKSNQQLVGDDVVAKFDKKTNKSTHEGYEMFNGVIITRAGVHKYKNGENQIEYQLKPAEEIFSKEHMSSAIGKPLTLNHPNGPIDVKNAKNHIIGTILKVYQKEDDDKNLYADIIIIAQDAINKIKNKELNQLSLGYSLTLEDIEGEFEGQKYQKRQKDMYVNHIALVKNSRIGKITTIEIDQKKNQNFKEDSADCKKTNIEHASLKENCYRFNVSDIIEEFNKINNKANNIADEELRAKQKEIEKKNQIIEEKNAEIQQNLIKIEDLENQNKDLQNKIVEMSQKIRDILEKNLFEDICKIKEQLNLNLCLETDKISNIYNNFAEELKAKYNIDIEYHNNDDCEDNNLPEIDINKIIAEYRWQKDKKSKNKKQSIAQLSQCIDEYQDRTQDPIELFNKINFEISNRKQGV